MQHPVQTGFKSRVVLIRSGKGKGFIYDEFSGIKPRRGGYGHQVVLSINWRRILGADVNGINHEQNKRKMRFSLSFDPQLSG